MSSRSAIDSSRPATSAKGFAGERQLRVLEAETGSGTPRPVDGPAKGKPSEKVLRG